MKNCDLGLENAALGLRPWAAFSRPRSQFFTIRTSQPANNIYISDSGQPFASDSFYEFARTYGFEHVTSSPLYAQPSGKEENAVKRAESLLEKATKSKRDPYLSLLDWRNTPTEGLNSSPAHDQWLFG